IRPRIRNSARIIISNPYALHQYLDWHDKWTRFYRNLRYIIIDEAHTYRGVFGSNVAQLLRRFCRILDFYGVTPQFILSSATINNPESFTTKLINYPVTVIDNDGAEYGPKHLLLWNPPFIDKFELKRRSPHQETRDLLVKHLQANLQTLTFTLSRKMAELISLWVKNDTENLGINQNQIMTYRAGYRPSERRKIEQKLRTRELQGVVSTNALEVGIDLGDLDAVMLSGFPGTIISTKQQMGRVGRSHNPENAIIDLENPYILKGHILCASAEIPLKLEDIKRIWGDTGKLIASELRREGLLKFLPSGLSSISSKRPASIISLNSAFSSLIEVRIRNKLLETLTLPQAYREAHEGAILIHQGDKFFVEELNLEKKTAVASSIDVEYYTEVLSTSEVTIIESIKSKTVGFQLFWGEVKATEIYHSFRKKTYDEVIETIPLDLPALEYETKAVWVEIPDELVFECQEKRLDYGGGIHAFEHATISLSPIYAMCDRWDIGGVSYTSFPLDGKSKIFIYDGFPGGIGISEKIFEKWHEIASNVLKLIQECNCADGCPSCVQSPKCGNENFPLSKKVAILLLNSMLKGI
ncbi:MAG: DEAD/DEAH box helicase, partial [Candidatus Hodarchaeales archaeon]